MLAQLYQMLCTSLHPKSEEKTNKKIPNSVLFKAIIKHKTPRTEMKKLL